jgi:hypothetical protein
LQVCFLISTVSYLNEHGTRLLSEYFVYKFITELTMSQSDAAQKISLKEGQLDANHDNDLPAMTSLQVSSILDDEIIASPVNTPEHQLDDATKTANHIAMAIHTLNLLAMRSRRHRWC